LFEAHEVGLLAALQWPGTRVILAHRSGPGVPGTRRHLLALRPLRRRIDHVVANSSGGAKMMLGIGLEAHRVSIIPNGLPTDRVRLGQSRASVRRDLGIGPDTPLMCAVSRPDPSKDFPTLFAALARVRSVNPNGILILVGPTADHLRKLGSALPPGALAIGFHPRPPEVMNASDVVVIASRTEGHSNVADEALMLGLPVATTDTGGHPALVAQSGGRVVPVGRGDLLGAAILKLLEAPPDRADVRAVAARRLDMTRVADATTALYGRVLAAPRPHPEMRSPAE
jgi:glycosyltransferase involved in cell wall biosynthesis